MVKHCVMYYGSEPAEGGANFTLQAGITPSQALLRLPLRAGIPQFASLTLTDGQQSATWRNCRMSRAFITQGTGGRYREITVLDRRWAWASLHFAIYGEYNRLDAPHGQDNIRTPRQMANLLLQAMGESFFDTTAMPNVYAGPTVRWDAANPAEELLRLCDQYGCLVTLSMNDTVVIYPDGAGQTPRPDQRQMDFTAALEPPVIPRALVFEGGETHIQHDLVLKPVALETDRGSQYYHQYVNIDDVSYKPANGWGAENPWGPGSFAGVTDVNDRRQAQKDVFRRYSIAGPVDLPRPSQAISNGAAGGKLTPQQDNSERSFFKVTRGQEWRLLPLAPYLNVASAENPQTEPVVLGYYFKRGLGARNTGGHTTASQVTTANANAANPDKLIDSTPPVIPGIVYRGNYTTIADKGHVLFDDPVYFDDATDGKIGAIIRLRCAFPIRNPVTHAPVCQQFWLYPGASGSANIAKVVKQSDIYYEYGLKGGSGPSTGTLDNESLFVQLALARLNSELYTYQVGTGYSAPYKGFVFDIPVDGVVRAITFDTQPGQGGTTSIDYNMERPEAYFTLQEAHNRRMANYVGYYEQERKRKDARGIK